MMKSSQKNLEDEIQANFDPVVPCAWLPDGQIKLSEYNHMITRFVQKRIKEPEDAVTVCIKKFTDR